MPIPSTVVTWDSNNTNTSVTTAGHQSDGWVNNEIPTAAEFNYWMKAVGDWINWFKTNGGDFYAEREEGVTADCFSLATSGSTFDSRAADWSWIQLGPADEGIAGVRLPNGDTITTIDFRLTDEGFATTYTVSLRRRDSTGTSGYSNVVTASDTSGGAGVGTLFTKTLTANHVMAAGYHYQLFVSNTGGTFPLRSLGANIKHKRV